MLLVMLLGQGPMVTAPIWLTTTLKVQVLVEQELVAVQITGVVPRPKLLPLAGAQLWSAPSMITGLA